MVLATANAQGELSPLEIGAHAYGLKHGTAKQYAAAVSMDAGCISRVKAAYEVLKLTQVNFADCKDKSNHLAAIHKLPEEAWPLAVEAMLAGEWSAKETSEKVAEALDATTPKREGGNFDLFSSAAEPRCL